MPRPAGDLYSDEVAWLAAQRLAEGELAYLDKGFSPDRKYRVRRKDGDFLLRLCDDQLSDAKRREFDRLGMLYALGLPVPEPISFHGSPPFAAMLFRWIEGASGEEVLSEIGPEKRVQAGLAAGGVLRRLHCALTPPHSHTDEAEVRGRKFHLAEEECSSLGLNYPKHLEVRKYVLKHLQLIANRPMVFRHGDYHPANMIFRDGQLVGIIDFNRSDFGDPYDDFYKTAYFAAPLAPDFARAVVMGYFEGDPPDEFWQIYNLCVAAIVPSDLSWCARYFPSTFDDSLARVGFVLDTHDFNGGTPPTWWIGSS